MFVACGEGNLANRPKKEKKNAWLNKERKCKFKKKFSFVVYGHTNDHYDDSVHVIHIILVVNSI